MFQILKNRLGFWGCLLVLVVIGVLRNGLEVTFGISDGADWYSWKPGIVFTMACFPPFLCFFTFVAVREVGRWLRLDWPAEPLLAALFLVQLLHLLVPFLDVAGNWLGVRYDYHFLGDVEGRPRFFEPVLGITFGIMVAWGLALAVMVRQFVLLRLGSPFRGLLLLVVVANLLYWPIYHAYPTFNTVFAWLTFDLFADRWFGYGAFFMLFTVIGAIGARPYLSRS